jgi:hypothetical protein
MLLHQLPIPEEEDEEDMLHEDVERSLVEEPNPLGRNLYVSHVVELDISQEIVLHRSMLSLHILHTLDRILHRTLHRILRRILRRILLSTLLLQHRIQLDMPRSQWRRQDLIVIYVDAMDIQRWSVLSFKQSPVHLNLECPSLSRMCRK